MNRFHANNRNNDKQPPRHMAHRRLKAISASRVIARPKYDAHESYSVLPPKIPRSIRHRAAALASARALGRRRLRERRARNREDEVGHDRADGLFANRDRT